MQNEMYRQQVMQDHEREIRMRIRERGLHRRRPAVSVRRRVGRSIIEIGHRIAAEPQASHPPRLARSR